MGIGATAIWRVRPSGSNTNGGGYDPGISGAATDYSQQNAAQATGVNGTASGTAAFSDTVAAAFTSAMIGNAIWIASGAGFTVGAYFVTAFTDASHITLDRSPGTGTVANWKLGGGWADFWTNTTSTLAAVVPSNIVYILGSGTPNPSSYTIDYAWTTGTTFANGSSASGKILYANDPLTPGYKAPPDTTGGMPVISFNGSTGWQSMTGLVAAGLWFVALANNSLLVQSSSDHSFLLGIVVDQSSVAGQVAINFNCGISAYGCEVFSSTGAAGSGSAANVSPSSSVYVGCNIHDTVANGISAVARTVIANCIIAKCAGDAINVSTGAAAAENYSIINNTIDGNTGNGIVVGDSNTLQNGVIINNIISNHTGVGKSGLTISAGSAAVNSTFRAADYNSYYNNTANYSGINAAAHDTALAVTPYVASTTENYTLA